MDIHILDIILYFIIAIIIWYVLPNDFTEDIGGILGIGIILIYTVIYIILFGVIDLNWSDLFDTLKIKFNIRW